MKGIIKENSLIDVILSSYEVLLGKDFIKYKNHVYRVFNLSIFQDSFPNNIDKFAIASAFHDIGIWTHSFDYLEPSIALAKEYLIENEKQEWIKEVSLMIYNHHRRSSYKGEFSEIVNVFKKSDWADVTMKPKSYGLSKHDFKSVVKEFPRKGFHWFLIRQTIKNFFKNPLNPLPMFKK